MKPHTYVLWTLSGQEDTMIKILHTANVVEEREPIETEAGITIPSSYETLFIPRAQYVKRLGGVDRSITQDLYPGYIFLSTPTPVNFFKRLRDVYFLRGTGKEVKMLRPQGVSTKATVSSTDTIEDIERKMADYMQRIDDDEEKDVLRLCKLMRNEQGDIVSYQDVGITEAVREKLIKAGVDPSSVPPSETINKNVEKQEKPADINLLFTTTMSHAVKVIKKGYIPGNREDEKIVIIDGPLVGMEDRLVRVNAHKKFAIVKSEFMHREVELKVPLEVVKVVEVA